MLIGQMTACAEANDGLRVALLTGRLVEVLKEIGRITGEVDRIGGSISIQNNIAILNDPRMIEFQRGLISIAREIPEARPRLLSLLKSLDDKPAPGRQEPQTIEGEIINAGLTQSSPSWYRK